MTTVLLVDDQELVRTGLRMILGAEDDLEVVGEASDGIRAIGAARELAPDVVPMDIQMPGMDGITATRRIVETQPGTRVLILTSFDRSQWSMTRSWPVPAASCSRTSPGPRSSPGCVLLSEATNCWHRRSRGG